MGDLPLLIARRISVVSRESSLYGAALVPNRLGWCMWARFGMCASKDDNSEIPSVVLVVYVWLRPIRVVSYLMNLCVGLGLAAMR